MYFLDFKTCINVEHQEFHVASARRKSNFFDETSLGCDIFRSFGSHIPQIKVAIAVSLHQIKKGYNIFNKAKTKGQTI